MGEWGFVVGGASAVPAGLGGVTAIAGSGHFSVALKSNGTVVAWGYYAGNNQDSGAVPASVPVGLNGVTAIAAGYDHAVALKSDGTVVAWGNNTYGQTAVPSGLSGITAISAASYHTLALKGDGTVVAWGVGLHLNPGITGRRAAFSI